MRVLEQGRQLWGRSSPFVRRHNKPILITGAVVIGMIITAQFLYPSNQALPRALLDGEPIGGKTDDEIIERTTTGFQRATVDLKAGELVKKVELSQLGVSADADAATKSILQYPWWQRLIPLSFIAKKPEVKNLEVTFSEEGLAVVAEALSEELSTPAENAQLTIAEGKLSTIAAKSGQTVTAENIRDTLKNTRFAFGSTTILLAAEEQTPAVTDAAIAAIRAQAEEVLQRKIVIVAENGREFVAEPTDITSWLSVLIPDQSTPELTANNEQITQYIQRLNGTVGTPPGTIKAVLVDGQEASRTTASSGLAIATDELREGIIRALFDPAAPSRLPVRMVVVPPSVSYDRSYTSSQKGLKAYVEHVAAAENVRIAVSQVGGRRWSAYGRSDEQTVSASTYKLYVAAMLFKQVTDGKLQWGSRALDTDAAGCLERMIVVSDNPCAEEFIRLFGGKQINEYLYSRGISRATSLITDDGIARTTAGDLEKIVRGIEDGTIVNGSDRARLLELMGRQRYRAGIPAGSNAAVYDKVGFLWDYINDAAIVRHPRGTYVIAVLTKGYSWGKVAEITRQIERILYP